MSQVEICRFSDADALASAAVERIIQSAHAAIAARGRFLFVLAGGSTPEKTYAQLATPGNAQRIDWSRVFIFFGDERVVPPEDSRSNYRMAWSALLSHVPIPEAQIFRISTDNSPASCAGAYSARLAQIFNQQQGHAPPSFDLILLGLGDDGHTASLFPGAQALTEINAWVTWSPPGVLAPPVDRVTMTLPVLNAAREVMFLVAGSNKAAPIADVLENNPSVAKRPAAGVRPSTGKLTWLLDAAAASRLV